uniref:Transmembrane protein 17 n=1 Tax=Spongospora subterranea TaxID=70186 RepID=A0A0H5RTX2_9EUKA|eukprot:CRZ12184.1 hypothetical protein [Spongospora subterranea]
MAILQSPEAMRSDALPGVPVPSHHPPKQLYLERQMSSSLSLQILLYYNVWYSGLYAVVNILITSFKISKYKDDQFVSVLTPILLGIWCLVEPCRLALAYAGNLQERIQHLAAFFFLTLFPQAFLVVYVLAIQKHVLTGETTSASIQIGFLVAELIIGYHTIQYIVKIQATRFRLDYGNSGAEQLIQSAVTYL